MTNMDRMYYNAVWVLAVGLLLLLLLDANCNYSCRGNLLPLERTYLPVYALAICADWLQGPYVYALYSAFGLVRTQINILFVMGFGASMLLGPFIGQFADRFGRKTMILVAYCGAYGLACVTKHVDSYWVLAVGRILGGAATSVLFSCFESWVVAEHKRLKLPRVALNNLFTRQYFVNGLTGCTIGIIAQVGVDSFPMQPLREVWDGASGWVAKMVYVGGESLPFDASALCLIAAAILVTSSWSENIRHHNEGQDASSSSSITAYAALKYVMCDWQLITIMVITSCTESAMYAFVIEWTPALTTASYSPPHGVIFSCFMIAYMSGEAYRSSRRSTSLLRPPPMWYPLSICDSNWLRRHAPVRTATL